MNTKVLLGVGTIGLAAGNVDTTTKRFVKCLVVQFWRNEFSKIIQGLGVNGYFLQKQKMEYVPLTQLESVLQEHTVVMFSKSGCRYCDIAKEIFDKEGVRPYIVMLDKPHSTLDMKTLLPELLKKTEYNYVPQIFLRGKFVGGARELQQMQANEQMKMFKTSTNMLGKLI